MPYIVNEERNKKEKPNPERKEHLEKITQEFIHNTDAHELNNFSEEYTKAVNPLITKTYIDISLLQTIYLGAILHMHIEDEQAYAYILTRLEAYSNRPIEEHARYFPELDITDEQILDFVTDPEHALDVIMASPATDVWKILQWYHQDVISRNIESLKIIDQKMQAIEYVVNIYPVKMSETLSRLLKLKFIAGLQDTSIKFGVISAPSHELDPALYSYFDTWFINDFNHWVNTEECNAYKAMTSLKLLNSNVIARPLIHNKEMINQFNKMSTTELKVFGEALIKIYNQFCKFEFIPSEILLYKK